ncbi:MAG: hypothetical protein ACK52I_00695 [Pseudomonadota bacterium]
MILFIYSLAVCIAFAEAWRDADAIAVNAPIDHAARWMDRAVITAVLMLVLVGLGALSFWNSVYTAIGSAFLFSAAFRYRLNTLRDLPFDYVSTSNVYDSVFIGLFGFNAGRTAYLTEAIITVTALVAYY